MVFISIVRHSGIAAAIVGSCSLVPALGQTSSPPPPIQAPGTQPAVAATGVEKIRQDVAALRPLAVSELARVFLDATADALIAVEPRTLYLDRSNPEAPRWLSKAQADALDDAARAGLVERIFDENFYYHTKYGSPLAYVRALDVLAQSDALDPPLRSVEGKRVLDFGYGTVGHLRLLASLGADAVGVDVDSLLPALYSEPGDQGKVKRTCPDADATEAGRELPGGSVTLIHGSFPADPATKAAVGGGYDLVLAKNTLKDGYLHPDRPVDPRLLVHLGVDDATFVETLFEILNPGGVVLIYNLSPAQSPDPAQYKPWADGLCPFPREMWEKAGFVVPVFDACDDAAARAMGHALGWDAAGMDLANDLFAHYTIAQKPLQAGGASGRARASHGASGVDQTADDHGASAVATAVDLGEAQRLAQGRLDAWRRASGFPGATLGFVLPDGHDGAVATGVSSVADGAAMRPDDRMLAGSVGKTFVAAVALQLVDEERLDLDARIATWLGDEPWFIRLPKARDITLRMLLNHTSGVSEHVMMPEFHETLRAEPWKVWKPEELVAFSLDKNPLFEAGRGWSYADTNFILAGLIIERVTGRRYYDELTDRILRPLRLDATSPLEGPDLPGLVSGYTGEGNPFPVPTDGEVARRGEYLAFNPQMEWCGGGVISNSRDLARWVRALFEGNVLKSATRAAMLEGIPAPRLGPNDRYGLGVQMYESPHGPVLGHSGWFPGYNTFVAYYAEHRLALAVQINTDDPAKTKGARTLFNAVVDDLTGAVEAGD